MFHVDVSPYQGKDPEQGFYGAVSERNFFAVLAIPQGVEKEEGWNMLDNFKQRVLESNINQPEDFDALCTDMVKEVDLSLNISFALFFINGSAAYMKTRGSGVVYIQRNRNFANIIHGDKIASGHIRQNDTFFLAAGDFEEKLKGEDRVKQLEKELQEKRKEGIMTVLQIYADQPSKKKTVTTLLVFIIFFILVWSVLLGYQRRTESQNQKKMQTVKELVGQKLKEAEDVVFLNSDRALALLDESKKALEKLEKQTGKKYEKQTRELQLRIQEFESRILKKEQKNFEEFFDLTVEDKDAQGDVMSLSAGNLFVFDKKGTLYTLALQKKSLSKKTFPELNQADFVSAFENQAAALRKNDGIYRIDKSTVAKVIEKDPEWESISGLQLYGGNIYVFDTGKGDVYKYAGSGAGFSEKTSYFKQGEQISMAEARSFAIDGSIYIAFDNAIIKYTSGVRDAFHNSFPDKDISIKKIYTNKELDRVYVWDKQKGIVYILDKKGTYERQVASDILKKAVDFTVFENTIYALMGPKIFSTAIP